MVYRTYAHVTEMERKQEAGGGACRERQTALVLILKKISIRPSKLCTLDSCQACVAMETLLFKLLTHSAPHLRVELAGYGIAFAPKQCVADDPKLQGVLEHHRQNFGDVDLSRCRRAELSESGGEAEPTDDVNARFNRVYVTFA